MAEQWPAQLQDKLNEADFTESLGDTTLRSSSEIGLAKVRRRFTKAVDTLTCSVFLEKDDVALFKSFYKTTLNGGVTTFEFTDPYDGTLQEFRFDTSTPPQISPVGGNTMNLRMSWERLP